eukprot:SAG11_NODE_20166_length_451_cov_1.019886_1_plen_34_part_10
MRTFDLKTVLDTACAISLTHFVAHDVKILWKQIK